MANKRREVPLITFSARIPQPLYDFLRAKAQRNNTSINKLVLKALADVVEQEKKEK